MTCIKSTRTDKWDRQQTVKLKASRQRTNFTTVLSVSVILSVNMYTYASANLVIAPSALIILQHYACLLLSSSESDSRSTLADTILVSSGCC